jgi:transcription termination factor Rho
MAVLERSELEASPLADLHAIADQLGLDGFRRLRKADLIDAILGGTPSAESDGASDAGERDAAEDDEQGEATRAPRTRRRRIGRRGAAAQDGAEDSEGPAEEEPADEPAEEAPRARARARTTGAEPDSADEPEPQGEPEAERGARRGRGGSARAGAGASAGGRERSSRGRGAASQASEDADAGEDAGARVATGVVEVLGNGSAFLRVDPPEPSDEDVYISAAQVRRCELVSGDEVSGPVRTPRRSERYPSLVRIDTINGSSADSVSDGSRYEDLPVAWPSERLALGAADPTLEAIEWLTPFGLGSRVAIVGARNAGKSETLGRLHAALSGRDGLELSLVLVGARPEEIAQWAEGPTAPAAALSFAASPDVQAQAIERVLDAAKRVAARGGNAVVLIDGLEGLAPHAARRALAAARNLRDSGSLTLVATAPEPLGGETTVIALDAALTSTGRQPILDLLGSGTLRPELLVGEDGAEAIAKARAAALEAAV